MQQSKSVYKCESCVRRVSEEAHTVFLFNLPYDTSSSDIKSLAMLYGEILNINSYINKKGHCFITFCDVRDSVKFVNDFKKGKSFNGRTVFANYAVSNKDNEMSCVIVCPSQQTSSENLNEDTVSEALRQYGEIKSISILSFNTFKVVFYNIKHASLALSNTYVTKTCDGVSLSISRDQVKQNNESSPLLTHYQPRMSFEYSHTQQPMLQRAYHPVTKEHMQSMFSPSVDPYSIDYQSLNFISRLIVAN